MLEEEEGGSVCGDDEVGREHPLSLGGAWPTARRYGGHR